jgi:restriction system protein
LLFWSNRSRKEREEQAFHQAHAAWTDVVDRYVAAGKANSAATAEYEAQLRNWTARHARLLAELNAATEVWESAEDAFERAKVDDLTFLTNLRNRYHDRLEPNAVSEFMKFLLLRSPYPASWPRSIDTAYDTRSGVLIAELQLPNLAEISIVKPKANGSSTMASDRDRKRAYADAIYGSVVRSLCELATHDEIAALRLIVVNGWLSYIDGATGQRRSDFVISAQGDVDHLREIALATVNPKECLRAMKAQMTPGLEAQNPAPVRRIMELNTNDRRIVEGRDIIGTLGEGTNLAAMDWDDFEHLIRQVFEAEFVADGAEVKITRASRDWGVDAIIFDPDPLRGGKFVIQAKRYTGVVGVEAVRDLYGTVVNEGANRGILVTTSWFGPESYEFAKGKPISLVDGQNLLAMLKRQGRQYRIDIEEAKRLARQ